LRVSSTDDACFLELSLIRNAAPKINSSKEKDPCRRKRHFAIIPTHSMCFVLFETSKTKTIPFRVFSISLWNYVIIHQLTPVNNSPSTFRHLDLEYVNRLDLHSQELLIDPILAECIRDFRGMLSTELEMLDALSDFSASSSQSLPSDTPESLAVSQIVHLSQSSL
jgi:hypothetical protein